MIAPGFSDPAKFISSDGANLRVPTPSLRDFGNLEQPPAAGQAFYSFNVFK